MILIAGGTGALGTRVVERLRARQPGYVSLPAIASAPGGSHRNTGIWQHNPAGMFAPWNPAGHC
jgi:uncharacterized protein YbjT (DUF2867 family)